MTIVPDTAGRRLAMFDALREPRYRLLWLAGIGINTGRWLDFVVLGWLALELTDSPLLVGLAAFCRMAPMMALGMFAGLLADRVNRGRLMIAVQVLSLVTSLTLALLFGTGVGEYWHLVALEVLLGVAWVIDFPSRRTVLYTLIGPGRLSNAVCLESASMQGTKMIGAVVGGVLLAQVGPSGCYLVLAALYLGALLLLVALNRRVDLPPTRTTDTVLASLATGLREVRGQRVILAVLAVTIVMNVLVFPFQQMLPIFARDILVVGPELLGLLVGVEGLGSLIGSLMVASRPNFSEHRRLFAGASTLTALLVLGLALSPWYLLSLSIQFLIGFAESGFGTMQSTIVLLAAPDQTRGRAMGILSACIGTQPLGSLWIGFATAVVGAPTATAAGALLGLALLLPLASRLVSRPTPRPATAL